jgi:hypothetical protein
MRLLAWQLDLLDARRYKKLRVGLAARYSDGSLSFTYDCANELFHFAGVPALGRIFFDVVRETVCCCVSWGYVMAHGDLCSDPPGTQSGDSPKAANMEHAHVRSLLEALGGDRNPVKTMATRLLLSGDAKAAAPSTMSNRHARRLSYELQDEEALAKEMAVVKLIGSLDNPRAFLDWFDDIQRTWPDLSCPEGSNIPAHIAR